MRELRFDGLSQDGTRVLLAGKDGQKWSLVIDEKLEAAIRRDRSRISQIELQQAGALRPREIQARIRAGATAEDVAAASGLPVAHIRRFEGPVLTERAWVAQQAQATEVRRPSGDIPLRDLVAERLTEAGVEPEGIGWDAWRRDDGLWVVIATFRYGPNTLVATWTYDATGRTMTVADDNARQLSAIVDDSPLRLAPARPSLAAVDGHPAARIIDLSRDERADSDLEDDEAVAGDRADVVGALDTPTPLAEDSSADVTAVDGLAPRDDLTEDAVAEADDEDAEADEDPAEEVARGDRELPGGLAALFEAPVPARRAAKPAVPSFDDILFGPGPR